MLRVDGISARGKAIPIIYVITVPAFSPFHGVVLFVQSTTIGTTSLV